MPDTPRHDTLTSLFDDIADSIRIKLGTGTDGDKKADDFDLSIMSIRTPDSDPEVDTTAHIPSKAADTYYVSSSNRTISSGQYLSGNQTIKGVSVTQKKGTAAATSGISASNVRSGVTIKVGDDADDDRLINTSGTFSASNTVSSGQTAASQADIRTGKSAFLDGEEIKGSMADGTLSADDSAATTAYNYPTSGTATEWGFKPTLTYDSTNEVFNYGGSKAVTVRGHAKVTSDGYLTSSDNTYKDVTVTVKAEESLPKIALGVTWDDDSSTAGNQHDTTKVKPVPTRKATKTGTGITITDAADGVAVKDSSSLTSGVYVAVNTPAITRNISVSPSVTTAGYGTTTSGQATLNGTSIDAGASASDDYYIPIKTANPSFTGGGLSGSANAAPENNVTLQNGWQDADHPNVDPGSGISIVTSCTATRADIKYAATNGWVSKSATDVAVNSGSTAMTGQRYYITGLTLGANKTLTVTNNGTLTVSDSSKGTTAITTNKVTENGVTTYSGAVNVNAYTNVGQDPATNYVLSGSKGIVNGGKWAHTDITSSNGPGTYYGEVSLASSTLPTTTSGGNIPTDAWVTGTWVETSEGSGDYDWQTTITIPAGWHPAKTYVKTWSQLAPAPTTAGTSAQLVEGYTLYNHLGQTVAGLIADYSKPDSATAAQKLIGLNPDSSSADATYSIPDGWYKNRTIKVNGMSGGSYSADVSYHAVTTDPVVTASITGNATGLSGVTTTQPSGTSGTDYWVFSPSAESTTTGKVKATAKATIDTAGYLATGNLTDDDTINVVSSTATGDTYYLKSGSASISASSNVPTTSSSSYYIELSKSAGYISSGTSYIYLDVSDTWSGGPTKASFPL